MVATMRDSRGSCPHCLTVVKFEHVVGPRGEEMPAVVSYQGPKELDERLRFYGASCPACGKLVLTIEPYEFVESSGWKQSGDEFTVWPLQSARPPVPKEVPKHIAADYGEAALVLNFSPKASAALSRRCLQTVLREAGGATQHNLSKQIDAVMPNLPSYIAESVDHIRNVGNFATHTTKDEASGQIVNVEPGEAEWNLDVLDMLFDHYYVKPALAKHKRDQINTKLDSAGRKPMK